MERMTVDQAAEQLAQRRQTPAAGEGTEQAQTPSEPETEPVETEPESQAAPEEDTPDPEPETEQVPETEEGEDVEFETVDELAEALGLSAEELLAKLRYKTKISGEEVERSLGEFLADSSKGLDYTKKTQQAARERAEFEQMRTKRIEALESEHAALRGAYEHLRNNLLGTMESEYVKTLQHKDPGRWAAYNQQIQQEAQRLDHVFQQARQAYEQNRTQLTQDFLKRQNEAILQARPDFGPQHAERIQHQLWELGFSPEETKMIGERGADARLLLGTLELAELRAENATLKERLANRDTTAKLKLKRKRDPGPVQKPGSSRTAAQTSQVEEMNAFKTLGKTKKLDDAVAVLKARRARHAKRK